MCTKPRGLYTCMYFNAYHAVHVSIFFSEYGYNSSLMGEEDVSKIIRTMLILPTEIV